MQTQAPSPSMLKQELEQPFPVSAELVEEYRQNGFVKLKQVFSSALLEYYRVAVAKRVAELSRDALPLDQRDTYGKAFLQIMNLWTESAQVKELVFSKRLGRIAADLMECSGVRLYHDQALYKEPGGGIAPWHADQYYWPVDSDKTVTAWIPLQRTPKHMGPLIFSSTSHRLQVGRDLEISDESELTLKKALEQLPMDNGSYDLGDVSFHAGWTFHRAGANTSDLPWEVMTAIYMDENIHVAPPRNKNHIMDMERWMPGLQPGDLLGSALNR